MVKNIYKNIQTITEGVKEQVTKYHNVYMWQQLLASTN